MHSPQKQVSMSNKLKELNDLKLIKLHDEPMDFLRQASSLQDFKLYFFENVCIVRANCSMMVLTSKVSLLDFVDRIMHESLRA